MSLLILATIIITGSASDSLGCPPTTLAAEPQNWHAYAVREPSATQTLYALLPGEPLSFNFTISAVDTFTVVVWGSNSAGPGCATTIIAQSTDGTTDVPPEPWGQWVQRTATMPVFDLAGRKVRNPQPHRLYFIPGGIVVIDAQGRMWIRKQGAD